MKQKIIKSFVLIVVGIVISLLSGCARVDTFVQENDDGSISECVIVELNRNEIESLNDPNYDIDAIKSDIKTTSAKVVQEMNEKLNIMADFAGKQEFKNGIKINYISWEGDKYYLSVNFQNREVYNFYYYGTTEVESIEPEYEEHFFYTKLIYHTRPTLRRTNDYNILSNMFKRFATKYPKLLNSSNIKLTYTYVGDYKRLHSNADYTYISNNKSYHVWELDRVYDPDGNLKGFDVNEDIELYFLVANKAHWMIVCIGAGLGISTILILIFVFNEIAKSRKNNKKLLNMLRKRIKNTKN